MKNVSGFSGKNAAFHSICIKTICNWRATGIDIETRDVIYLEAAIVKQQRCQDTAPAAQNMNGAQVAAMG
ncbi:MAG: hypothetical protein VX075_15965, partial [Pseudomonadota bacterium]|nr:hypothetical protein [Pseudomonadota bacterium]